jgi:hypothetical protein
MLPESSFASSKLGLILNIHDSSIKIIAVLDEVSTAILGGEAAENGMITCGGYFQWPILK